MKHQSDRLNIKLKTTENRSYKIVFSHCLNEVIEEIVNEYPNKRYFIITDSNVKKIYGKKITNEFTKQKINVKLISFPAGEKNKHRDTFNKLQDALIKYKADRSSIIIAFGGGVVGDIAGFVAATIFRSIPYIQIPTTLLAQVDSSVGGKVAINHHLGKNLIGVFYHPKRVYIVTDTLKTLPNREIFNGMAEVIKTAVICDPKLFSIIEKYPKQIIAKENPYLKKVIKRCCKIKKTIVEQDEHELGVRRTLNFGHTIGHAIETFFNYNIHHGYAVAIGMAYEARLSAKLGFLNNFELVRLLNLLHRYHLPTELPENILLNDVLEITKYDKKSRNGAVAYTLLEKIGRARCGVLLTQKQVIKILEV